MKNLAVKTVEASATIGKLVESGGESIQTGEVITETLSDAKVMAGLVEEIATSEELGAQVHMMRELVSKFTVTESTE